MLGQEHAVFYSGRQYNYIAAYKGFLEDSKTIAETGYKQIAAIVEEYKFKDEA